MRRDVSIQISILTLLVCAVLAGCGASGGSSGSNSGGSNPPPTSNVTMHQGQWEFVVNNGTYYVEANLTDAGNAISSNVYNTQVFDPGQAVASSPPGVDCGNVGLNGTISGNSLTGTLGSGGSTLMNFYGSLNSTGQSVSNGTATAPNEICGIFGSAVSGATFTGYTISSFTGTFAGQITTWPNGTSPLSLNLTLTQSPDFSLAGSGQITGQGNVQTLVFPNSATVNSTGVFGATFILEGTSTDASGSMPFEIYGHWNSNFTQITLNALTGNNTATGTWQTGTLTKQ